MTSLYDLSDDQLSSFASSDTSDDFSVDDALEQLGDGVRGVQLSPSELVGRGAFGAVYKVSWKGRPAALKVIEHENADEEDVSSWSSSSAGSNVRRSQALLEAAVSSAIKHPHIVETYDYQLVDPTCGAMADPLNIITGSMELRMLMEWCDAGSLMMALEDGRLTPVGPAGEPSDFEAICLTLLEVALAMHHLHCMHIIHCDLKAKNVLLSSSQADPRGFVAKVSDFGLSKLVADSVGAVAATQYSSEASGTVTHMAPEVLTQGRVLPAADVYAFGILMWEAYMGEAPYLGMTKMQVMYGVTAEELRPCFPQGTPTWFSRLAAACWCSEPEDRPSFTQLCQELQEKLWQVQEVRLRGRRSSASHGDQPVSPAAGAFVGIGPRDSRPLTPRQPMAPPVTGIPRRHATSPMTVHSDGRYQRRPALT